MKNKEKFGPFEAASMVIVTIVGKMLLTSPRVVIDKGGTAAWLITLISALVGTLGFYVILALLRRFPDRELPEIFNITFGKFLGALLILVLFLLFMYNGSLSLREFTESMKTYVYPYSPPSYMIGMLMLAIIPLSFLGIEALARVTGVLITSIITAVAVILLLASPLYQPYYLTPLLGYGFYDVVVTGAMRSSVYGDVIILGIFAKCLQGEKYIKKAGLWAIAISGAVLVFSFIGIGMVYPFNVANELTIPIFQLTRLIRYSRFIQRLESIFIFAWSVSSILMVTIYFCTALSLYCRAFNIDDYKPLIIPGGILLFSLSMYPPDITYIAIGQINVVRQYAWVVYFLLPAAALLMSFLFKKRGALNA